jgi:hypothetical protein
MTISKPVKIAPGYDNSDWKALKLDRALSFSLQPHGSVPIETFERFRLVRDGRGLVCYSCRNFQRRDETEQRYPDGNLPEA